jgi:urea transporter
MIPLLRSLLDEVLVSLGTILFTVKRRSGFVFLLALLLAPLHALAGLLGFASARVTSRLLSPENTYLKLGLPQGAGLLAGLALSVFLPSRPVLFFFVVLAGIFAGVLLHAVYPLLGRQGLPGLAFAFVIASWVMLATLPALGFPMSPLEAKLSLPVYTLRLEGYLAGMIGISVKSYLTSFGSLLFLPTLSTGILVVIGLLIGSRITGLAMICGGAIGVLMLHSLSGQWLPPTSFGLIAFNAILTAGALSGIFLVLTPASLLYSLLAVIVSVLLTSSLNHLLMPVALPVLAMPFTLTVWLFLLPLRKGMLDRARLNIWAPPLELIGNAEQNLRAFERWQRERVCPEPVLSLPLHGWWKVTQGPGGSVTHNTELLREAWDFMLVDEAGQAASWPGEECSEFYGFGAPVLAPADGVITALEGALDDNPVHQANTAQPWGNWLMITHDSGTVSLLAHLRAGSIRAMAGQRVSRGQLVAHVGNSGRSPEPHLHYQLNEAPWLAAKSLPALFSAYVSRDQDALVFHPVGRPQEGQVISDLRGMDWADWSAFLPWSIPSSSWTVRCRRGSREEIVTLALVSGSDGSLLLDDGEVRARVYWWPDWLQLHPLAEADPDHLRSSRKDSLLGWMLAMTPSVPLKGIDGLRMEQRSWSRLAASGLRALLGLEQSLELSTQLSLEMNGRSLVARTHAAGEGGQSFDVEWIAEARRGLTVLHVTQKGRELFHAEWLAT